MALQRWGTWKVELSVGFITIVIHRDMYAATLYCTDLETLLHHRGGTGGVDQPLQCYAPPEGC